MYYKRLKQYITKQGAIARTSQKRELSHDSAGSSGSGSMPGNASLALSVDSSSQPLGDIKNPEEKKKDLQGESESILKKYGLKNTLEVQKKF
jgi:hypothetical protein